MSDATPSAPDRDEGYDIDRPRLTPQGRSAPDGSGEDQTSPDGGAEAQGQPSKAEG